MAGEAGTHGSAADAPRPYGRPGQALRLGPFLFGLIAAVGVLIAVDAALGVRRAGTILVAIVVAGFLSAYFAGVPYPLLMAVLVAGFDLIPQVGATLGSTIVTLTAWTSSFGLAVATLAFFCAYQGLENWIVYPRVMSRTVKISNLAAIIAALLGGAVFGVLGVLLAVPVYASVQLLVREVLLPRQDAR